jgi:hypothetical protein
MTRNKIIVILGSIFLCVLFGFYFFVIKNSTDNITSESDHPTIDLVEWQDYIDDFYGFKIKIPSNWEKYASKDARLDRWFLGKSSSTNYTLRIKINMYGELVPLFPDYNSFDFASSTAEVGLLGGRMKRLAFVFSSREGASVFGDFCLNKELDIKKPEPDFKASEATMVCPRGYDLYDFNLLCTPVGDECSDIFDRIVTSFEFVK